MAGVDLYSGVSPELAEAARAARRALNVKLNEQVRLLMQERHPGKT